MCPQTFPERERSRRCVSGAAAAPRRSPPAYFTEPARPAVAAARHEHRHGRVVCVAEQRRVPELAQFPPAGAAVSKIPACSYLGAGHLPAGPGAGASLPTVTARRVGDTRYPPFCTVSWPSALLTGLPQSRTFCVDVGWRPAGYGILASRTARSVARRPSSHPGRLRSSLRYSLVWRMPRTFVAGSMIQAAQAKPMSAMPSLVFSPGVS
jgi:hypothetical protein